MKIGILTFHASHNYGAFLQAYSLTMFLRSLGHNAEVINFDMKVSHDYYLKNTLRLKTISSFIYGVKRYLMFKNNLKKTDILSKDSVIGCSSADLEEIISKNNYDLIVAGSDEIWRINGIRSFPNPYWLNRINGIKKVSYAASSRENLALLPHSTMDLIRTYLKDFYYIGVRDNSTKYLIDGCCDDNCSYINCDPTFLFTFENDKNDCKAFIRKKYRINNNKRIICLMLSDNSLVNLIDKKHFDDCVFISLFEYLPGIKNKMPITPFEWIKIIAGCDGIVTNFFHATVFALKNDTPFLSVDTRTKDNLECSKLYDLLSRNKLTDCFISATQTPKEIVGARINNFISSISSGNYANVNYSIVRQEEKQLARTFLDALMKLENEKEKGSLS